MAKRNTIILYAHAASIPALMEAGVKEAREGGQAVRLIELEQFRGETEVGAGQVFVERSKNDDELFAKVEAAYPDMEVKSFEGKLARKAVKEAAQPVDEELELRALRKRLVTLGGSAPAGADAAQLADLIAARMAAANADADKAKADKAAADKAAK